MILSTESQKAIDTYLNDLRKQLRPLAPDDAGDIVEEIRAHIVDKTGSGKATGINSDEVLASTLAALGTPEELAARYRTDELLKRAQSTRSPFVSLLSLARWATLSLIGLVTFFLSMAGYTLGTLLLIAGMLKLIYPNNGGIWFDPKPGSPQVGLLQILRGGMVDGSAGFSFGSGNNWTHPGHEIFRFWLAPTCLAVGVLLIFLTFRLGTWCLRKFWRPSALREV
jgi:hypothetical protein